MNPLRLRIQPSAGPPIDRECIDALSFGRAAEADVVIGDGSMSRRHARFVCDAGEWFVEDLGARNGTFVNGERIEGRRRVADGDVIKMGATLVRVGGPDERGGIGGPPVLALADLASSIFRPVVDIVGAEELPDAAPTRAAARLKALNAFHRALAEPISLDALLERLLDRLFAALQPEEGVILLRQKDGTLSPAASRRPSGARGELLVSRRLTEEVVEKGTAALVTDLALDERFAAAQSIAAAGVRSILAAPIGDAAGCVGMVAVYSRAAVRRFGEEDLELLVSLASAAALRIRNVALAEEAAARRVQDRELALAHDIQMAMLPRAMPELPALEMAARLMPARAVGGDLYDFLVIDGALWFVVADAAGKGVGAALFMAVTRTLFRAIAQDAAGVAAVTARMNAELARDNERQFFVTAVVGRLDLHSGALRYAIAGHPPPLYVTGAAAPQPLSGDEAGIALGILDDADYRESAVTLAPGDLLVAFTDGVTDAVNADGRLFSDDRLRGVVAESAGRHPREIVDAIVDATLSFAAGVPQEDDITVLALRFRG